jgi:hypothetical protein
MQALNRLCLFADEPMPDQELVRHFVSRGRDEGFFGVEGLLAVGRWPLAVCRWPLAVGRLPLAVCRWPFAVRRSAPLTTLILPIKTSVNEARPPGKTRPPSAGHRA